MDVLELFVYVKFLVDEVVDKYYRRLLIDVVGLL
jgi:hypothetical protein